MKYFLGSMINRVRKGYNSRVADRKQRLCTDIGELLAGEDKQ